MHHRDRNDAAYAFAQLVGYFRVWKKTKEAKRVEVDALTVGQCAQLIDVLIRLDGLPGGKAFEEIIVSRYNKRVDL